MKFALLLLLFFLSTVYSHWKTNRKQCTTDRSIATDIACRIPVVDLFGCTFKCGIFKVSRWGCGKDKKCHCKCIDKIDDFVPSIDTTIDNVSNFSKNNDYLSVGNKDEIQLPTIDDLKGSKNFDNADRVNRNINKKQTDDNNIIASDGENQVTKNNVRTDDDSTDISIDSNNNGKTLTDNNDVNMPERDDTEPSIDNTNNDKSPNVNNDLSNNSGDKNIDDVSTSDIKNPNTLNINDSNESDNNNNKDLAESNNDNSNTSNDTDSNANESDNNDTNAY